MTEADAPQVVTAITIALATRLPVPPDRTRRNLTRSHGGVANGDVRHEHPPDPS